MRDSISPLMCETCAGQGRESQSVFTFIVGEHQVPVCQKCAAELLMQLDYKLAIWANETGQRITVGPQPVTWADVGITIPPGHKKGYVSVDCPHCNRTGAMVADLDTGTGKCRMCGHSVTVDE
jgi:ssDNA-binding Zn-finger/Zn-ribbon topoisomerase 1